MEKVQLAIKVLKNPDFRHRLAEFFTEKSRALELRLPYYIMMLRQEFIEKYPEYADITLKQMESQIARWRRDPDLSKFCDPLNNNRTRMYREKCARVDAFVKTLNPELTYTLIDEYEELLGNPEFASNDISFDSFKRIRRDMKKAQAVDNE